MISFCSSGMGFRPMINVESTLIRFSADDPESYKPHIEDIKAFIKKGRVFSTFLIHIPFKIPLSLLMQVAF